MNAHTMKPVVLILALSGVVIGYILKNPLIFGLCKREYIFGSTRGCLDSSIGSIGSPLLVFSIFFFFVSLLGFFVYQAAYSSWVRFTKWYLPIAILLIVFSPDTGGQYMIAFDFNRTIMATILGVLFAILSVLLIAYKSWRLRGA